jgi:uncharacterized membrane protein
MMSLQKTLIGFVALLFSVHILNAQFIVKDVIFSANGVSNEGKVSGYEMQAGPYGLWLPDSGNVIVPIGGIAPGLGVGGQARFTDDGNLISGTSMGAVGPELSIYNRSADQWTALGSLGFSIDSTFSGGYAVSGDGSTVVGNAWADTTGGFAYTHAVAFSSTEGMMDLGSLFSAIGRSTRANATSYDGSVVVGWQDFNGPWKSAVWRKNPAGGYYPNEYILIDTTANPFDEFNQLGECSAVSADGVWIGGYGDYANNNEPWIWSSDSGLINLGTLPNVGNGFVAAMSADAAVVVGWFDGMFFGDPQTPFIWTRTGGLQEFNDYIHNVLGDSTDTHQVYTAESISPDGHYVAGYGVDNATFTYFVYRVSLGTTAVHEIAKSNETRCYPNPTSGMLTVEQTGNATLTVCNMQGQLVYKTTSKGKHVLDLVGLAPGVYSLMVQKGDAVQMQKIVKK